MGPAPHGHRVLPHHPASVRVARAFVRDVLDGEVPIETVEAAETVASELTTNAVVHAGTAVEIEVRVDNPASVYLAVTDGAPQHPVRPRTGVERSTGRGLALVGSLSREWGVELHPDRKVLWCRLGSPHESPHGRAEDASRHRRMPLKRGFDVVLANAPLRVYRSWIEDAEALLRDYLLAGIEEASLEESLRRHVECSEALALLVEAFPDVSADGGASETVLADGHARVTLSVPPESVEDFLTLNEVLESAIKAATSGEYLSAVTSAVAQNFRRWLCREVLGQSLGAKPTPWVAGAEY